MAPFSAPFQLARARSRCCSISRSKPSRSMLEAALARHVFLLVERQAEGVVELEGNARRESMWPASDFTSSLNIFSATRKVVA